VLTTWFEFAVAGLSLGSLAALAGLGVVLTYQATGIFNLAQGAIATFAAYVYWQLAQGWGLPPWLAAAIAVVVVSPALGLLLDRIVFRPLARTGASTSEQLVATLGVLVVLVGLTGLIWGQGTKSDVPPLFPVSSVPIAGGVAVPLATLAQLGVLLVVIVGITVVGRWTRFGVQARAVVDRRELAELAGIDTGAVSGVAWGVGSAFAGLAGVLLAVQFNLSPFNLTLLVLETFAVVVLGRLTSLSGTVGAALGLGILQSELVQLDAPGALGVAVQSLHANLFVAALLLALLLLPRLREVGSDAATTRSLASGRIGSASASSPLLRRAGLSVALAAVVLPLTFGGEFAGEASRVIALAIIFVSLVVVTGYSGQLSLGQAGFAGLGALLYALLLAGRVPLLPAVPAVPATLLAALLVVPVGALVGYPALRRRGLSLGLTTLAVALALNAFVFNNPALLSGLQIERPRLLGLELEDERGFYLYAALLFAATLLLARSLRTGRLGLALGAMRDSEDGARAIGLDLLRLKLFVFAVSAGMAALGGALLVQSTRAFDPGAFQPLLGLLWFTAVVVSGLSSVTGAVLAASLYVAIDFVAPPGSANLLFGGLALLLGRLPGGLAGIGRRGARVGVPRRLTASYVAAQSALVPPPRTLNARGRLLATALSSGEAGPR
jgi:branched-chain amino acid transport system permease protein